MNRTAKLIKGAKQKENPQPANGVKIQVSDVLAKFDELWRIEHSELVAELKTKERKAREVREMIAALDN